ncbi:MAG: proton-conducting transporter membrane subunit [Anaerolineae bacterium]|jgi:multicomponent Na+:H+ antiporter subunit D
MNDHLVLLPILLPLTGAAVALLLRKRQRLQAAWSLAAMLGGLGTSVWLLAQVWSSGQPVIFQSGGWPAPFGISLVGDLLSATMVVMSQTVLALGTVYALGSRDKVVRYPAFYPIFLTLATGLTGAMLTGDLFNLFVFAELLVFSGTILTAVSDDRLGTEAAFKYFYMSLLASAFLLLAAGSLYVSYGTLNMADLAQRIAANPNAPLLPVAIALLFATFMVKSAVTPFHFWQPDFHTASPTAVSAMLSSVVVKLGVYGFLRMTTLLFVEQAAAIQGLLVVLGVAGIIYGGLGAVGTHNAKRMLAYSTLAQVGFILVAIGWGSRLALAAALIFAINHSLIKAALLMLAGAVASRAPVKTAAFDVITGVGKSMPQAGLLFFLGGLALVGIPPTNGFISKMMLFSSGIDAGQFTTLAAVGLVSVLTLIYVVRAFQRIWWQSPAAGSQAKSAGDRLLAPALLIAAVLLLGLWPEPLVRLAEATAAWLGDPEVYIRAVLGG